MTARYVSLLAGGLIVLAMACGGSPGEIGPAAAPETAVRAASAESPPDATAEPTAQPSPDALTCRDPYADGVPYPATPGQSLRLRPTGNPPPLEPFRPAPLVPDATLERIVRESIGRESDHFSVSIKNLRDNSGVLLNPAHGYYSASLFKTWVMLEAFHQREAGLLRFDERFVVSDYYERLRLNQGELPACAEVTAQDALSLMMSVSDNVAANLLYDRLGYSNVNNVLRQFGLAYSGLSDDGALFTTAGGMGTLLEAIALGQADRPEASAEMFSLLALETVDDRIPALLPPGTSVAHKTGSWDNATHDAGVVYSPSANYVVVALTDYGYAEGGAARIAQLSKAVYDYYNPPG